jgi:hypothetical protein
MSYVVAVVSVLSGGAAVGILAAVVSRIQIKHREAETRKRCRQEELTDFLVHWKGKINSDYASNLPLLYHRELPQLQTKAAAVRADLGEIQRAKFNELIGNLSRLTTGQISCPQGKSPQEVICEPISALMRYIEVLN